jgi:hypothetical protein
VTAPSARRIWHAEVHDLCARLESAGAWQTAVRVRVAHIQALARRPAGTAFDYRSTPEDAAPLTTALDRVRGTRRGATGSGHYGAA